MIQKLLRIFLIDRVQEYYLINFMIISVAFLAFHWSGFMTFIQDSDDPYKLWGLPIIIGLYAYAAALLVVKQDHKFLNGSLEVISFPPLVILTTVSLMGVILASSGRHSPLETIINFLFLLRYGLRLFILVAYSFMSRNGYTKNRYYKAIKKRLRDSVGDYQVAIPEGIMMLGAGVLIVFVFALTSINPFTQYLIAFMIVQSISGTIQKNRSVNIKN